MKSIGIASFLLCIGLQIAAAQQTATSNTLAKEFQNLPPIDLSSMSGYEWAVLKKEIARAVETSGNTIRDPLPYYGGGTVKITIAGPNYADNYSQHFADQINKLTNRFLLAIGPFVKSTREIQISIMPADRGMFTSPATASLGASELKPSFHSGASILFPQVWNASINRLGTIPGIEIDAATAKTDKFPWVIKTKWTEAKYKLTGFIVREQITLTVYKWTNGSSIGLSVDSEIQMRRLSEDTWMAFPMDSQSLGYLRPTKQETTQDICLGALSNELRN